MWTDKSAQLKTLIHQLTEVGSVVIDGLGMFWMAGKWKLTGDGSSGQPWTTFK